MTTQRKTIKVKYDAESDSHYLDLEDFKDLVDISQVKKYTLEEVDDDGVIALILKFYNDNDEVINVSDT
jgi:uncharacterized protein YuzE